MSKPSASQYRYAIPFLSIVQSIDLKSLLQPYSSIDQYLSVPVLVRDSLYLYPYN